MAVALVISFIFVPLFYVYFYDHDPQTNRLTVSVSNLIGIIVFIAIMVGFVLDPHVIRP